MKPRVSPFRTRLGLLKWRCELGSYVGTGYTPAAAIEKFVNAVTCRRRISAPRHVQQARFNRVGSRWQ